MMMAEFSLGIIGVILTIVGLFSVKAVTTYLVAAGTVSLLLLFILKTIRSLKEKDNIELATGIIGILYFLTLLVVTLM